jgi:hypothetical protein
MALLAAVLSLDGISLTWPRVEDCVLRLRLVSRAILSALESNPSLKINIYITETGVKSLTVHFLQRWQGNVCLHCTHPWKLGSRWFIVVSDALISGRLRPLSILSLSVEGKNLLPLVNTLVETGSALQQLEITYHGDESELLAAAASLAILGHALTMKISVQVSEPGGRHTCMWLQNLLASSIVISSVSFRYVR